VVARNASSKVTRGLDLQLEGLAIDLRVGSGSAPVLIFFRALAFFHLQLRATASTLGLGRGDRGGSAEALEKRPARKTETSPSIWNHS